METIAQIGQGLLYGVVWLIVWYNGPAQQHRRLIAWERRRPGRVRRMVLPVSWCFCVGAGLMVSTVIAMNMRLIFHW